MVATEGDEPVAVVLGAKAPGEVRVRRIGVAFGHQRRGHGRHLLASLGHKLAVLGPPRLVTEVPVSLPVALAFFSALGWNEEERVQEGDSSSPERIRFATTAQPA
jgi:hypothetical protein